MNTKPYVRQMIKEAEENLGGKATYSEIKDYTGCDDNFLTLGTNFNRKVLHIR